MKIDFPYRPDAYRPIVAVTIAALICSAVLIFLFSQRIWSISLPLSLLAFLTINEHLLTSSMEKARKRLARKIISLRLLYEWVKRHPGWVYLGHGFEWGIDQARAAWLMYHTAQRHHLTTDNPEDSVMTWMRLLGDEKPLSVPLGLFHNHMQIPGTTRSGKTVALRLLAAQAIFRGEGVVVLAPKEDPDFEKVCRDATDMAGSPFYLIHLGLPERSLRINPLRNFNVGTEIASRIAQLIPSETGGDPFKAFSFMATAQILLAEIESGERPTLRSLKHHLEHGVHELVIRVISAYCSKIMPGWESKAANVLRSRPDPQDRAHALAHWYLHNVPPHLQNADINGLIGQMEHDRQHFDKMVTSLMPLLTELTAGEMGELLSPSPGVQDPYNREILDIAKVCNTSGCLYISLDTLPNRDVGQAVGAILCAELASIAGDRQKSWRDRRPDTPPFPIVNVLIDEAAEIVNGPLVMLTNKGAGSGANMRVVVCSQTLQDYEVRLGSAAKAEVLFGNINNIMMLRVQNKGTQDYLAHKIGTVELQRVNESTGEGAIPGLGVRQTVSRHIETTVIERVPKSVLGELPILDYLLLATNGRTFKGRLPIVG